MSKVRMKNGTYDGLEFNLTSEGIMGDSTPPSVTLTMDDGSNPIEYTLSEQKDGDFFIYVTDAPEPEEAEEEKVEEEKTEEVEEKEEKKDD